MAWTPPATAAVGTLDTAALWNTNVRDNLLWLSSPPRCRAVANTTNQSIPDTTHTAVTWNAETYDTAFMHSTSVNPSRLTATVAGLYVVTSSAWFSGNAAGYRFSFLYKNGSQYGQYSEVPSSNTGGVQATIYDEIQCAAGDYLETYVSQTTGAPLTINYSSSVACYMTMRWVATS